VESLRSVRLLFLLALLGCDGGGDSRAMGPPPTRIIALAPSAAEILFALDLGGRVVGVGDHVSYPPEAQGKTRVGGLFDVRLEVIASLRPDLAVLLPSEDTLREQLERLDVETLEVSSESLADFADAVRAIAARCGVQGRGEDLLADFRRGLEPRFVETPVKVALTVGREPGRLARFLVAGPDTYLDELLALAGATNAFADAPTGYPEVGLEEIMRRNPDAIIELRTSPVDPASLYADWRASPMIGAVGNDCLAMITGEHVLIPGPRLPRLYRELSEALDRCEAP
jgi:iron complex transport system substrate-binding protein